MTSPRASADGTPRGPVSAGVALVFAMTGFIALLIFGLGMVSLALDDSVIETPGLGQLPGIVAFAIGVVVFALTLWRVVVRVRPSFWNAAWVAASVFLGYLAALWIAVTAASGSIAVASGVTSHIATTWFGVVIVATACVCAWVGIALTRTRARRPQWPWEHEDE